MNTWRSEWIRWAKARKEFARWTQQWNFPHHPPTIDRGLHRRLRCRPPHYYLHSIRFDGANARSLDALTQNLFAHKYWAKDDAFDIFVVDSNWNSWNKFIHSHTHTRTRPRRINFGINCLICVRIFSHRYSCRLFFLFIYTLFGYGFLQPWTLKCTRIENVLRAIRFALGRWKEFWKS